MADKELGREGAESLKDRLDDAVSATDARQWDDATRLWDSLRPELPDDPEYWRKAGQAYCENGMFARADELLEEALRSFPEDVWLAHQHVVTAQRGGAGMEALRRARWLRDSFPEHPIGYVVTGEALRDLERLDEAERAFAEAVERFPEYEWSLFAHAGLAAHRGDWAAAADRWDEMLRQFPGSVPAILGSAEALERLGQVEDADSVLTEACARLPADIALPIEHAALAARREEWNEALWRWRRIQKNYPRNICVEIGIATALIEVEHFDEAKTTIDAVLASEPNHQQATELCQVLRIRRDPHGEIVRELSDRRIEALLPGYLSDPEVLIEITSICNFACSYCVSPMKLREKKQMSMSTFRQVMEQVATITTQPVRLHVDGEPTSHPQFKEMALLVNSHGLPVWLATNGSRLDASFLEIWMDPLISMSTSPEELAERHPKLNFGRYIDRIANYAKAWSRSQAKQNIFFQIINYPQETVEVDQEYKIKKNEFLAHFCERAELYETCDEQNSVSEEVYRLTRKAHPGVLSFIKQSVAIGGLYPFKGQLLARERASAGFCDAPWRQLVVHSDGTLGCCCVDLSGGTTFATAQQVENVPIKELWENSPQIARIRELFLEGRIEREVCQRCLSQGQVFAAAGTARTGDVIRAAEA